MNRLLASAFVLLLAAAAPLTAQEVPAPLPAAAEAVPAEAPKPPVFTTVKVVLTTSLGPITLALETQRAPLTSTNFLRYIDQKKLDGTNFYRAMAMGPNNEYGLIQGGVAGASARSLPPVKHEPTTQTGLSNTNGVISMARGAPGTAAGDFFIIIGDLSSLDAKPGAPGDNLGFAAFGSVVGGMEVVKAIQLAPVSATKGEGAMKGQMIEAPVRIITARRAPK
jgi:peptidyl-prolyl cis-trans isomerase A (cyclophilin A)